MPPGLPSRPGLLLAVLKGRNAGDLADYILSLSGMTALRDIPRDRLVSVLEANMSDGVLTVPKEYGMFIARP